MKDSSPPVKRRLYDDAFRAEALRLASESRSTQAAARALNIDPERIYKWQQEAPAPVAAARGAELDPATAAELRQLRALARRQAQELDILKKARWSATAACGHAPAVLTGAPAQSLHPAHHGLHPRAALRPEPPAQPAQADPG